MKSSTNVIPNAQASDFTEYSCSLMHSGAIHFNGPVSVLVLLWSEFWRAQPKSATLGVKLFVKSTFRAARLVNAGEVGETGVKLAKGKNNDLARSTLMTEMLTRDE